ncbi:MAG: hypothetical protein IPP74_02595 [Alphaproteobacteria bacterium]|jgi:hypothetical protein|nr:hypothetical protein [Alphaproteobacteria bacterium]
MNDSRSPISRFEELMHMTEQALLRMDLDELIHYRKLANREFHLSLTAIRALTTAITKKLEAQGNDNASDA